MKYFYNIVSKLPMSFLYFLSDVFYVFISRFYRKKVVEMNIKKSFPNLSERELVKIKNRFYNNFCDIFFETIKSYTISKSQLLSSVRFKNIDVINNHV
jgi:Lauroyl/myristoyl acyltransferase